MPSPALESIADCEAPVCRFTLASPVGPLTIFEQAETITGLVWSAGKAIANAQPSKLLAHAASQLDAYFAGRAFDFDLPLAPAGTDFERRVWRGLEDIPAGTTLTYGGLARRLKTGPRAVGRACGANPIPILIPCHRVLGAGGSLHGYSGRGGIMTKAALLRLEGISVSV
jgi:methylated-DNA-[protein]-cysteine S-methyltransferase